MSDLVITGWKDGLKKISLVKVLQKNSSMGLTQAKQAVDDLMDGKEIRLTGLSDERVVALRHEIEALNAICR